MVKVMVKVMVNFNNIPEWWALCPGYECPRAGECLRHLAFRQAPAEVKKWKCVLPHVVKDGACEFFRKAETVTMASGLNAIYRNITSKQARSNIRKQLTDFLGSKGTYYRYKDGERVINPKLQQEIRDMVHLYAPDAEVSFDKTFEDYDFT